MACWLKRRCGHFCRMQPSPWREGIPQVNDDKSCFYLLQGPSHAQELWHKRPSEVSLCSLISCSSCFLQQPQVACHSLHTQSFLSSVTLLSPTFLLGLFSSIVTWLTSPHPLKASIQMPPPPEGLPWLPSPHARPRPPPQHSLDSRQVICLYCFHACFSH